MAATDQAEAPSGVSAAAEKNGQPSALPRLGSPSAQEAPALAQREVEIPERGVSLLLQKPSVEDFVALQEREVDEDNERQQFEASVELVASMLVEPEWTKEQLQDEVKLWSMEDWSRLQDEASKLAGFGSDEDEGSPQEGAEVAAAQEAFPGKDE